MVGDPSPNSGELDFFQKSLGDHTPVKEDCSPCSLLWTPFPSSGVNMLRMLGDPFPSKGGLDYL